MVTRWFILVSAVLVCLQAKTALACEAMNIFLIPKKESGWVEPINAFNRQNLEVLKRYRIQPLIDNYPPHVTLYLTDFCQPSLAAVKHQLSWLAKHTPIFSVALDNVVLGAGGYVMLNLGLQGQSKHQGTPLQALSDAVVRRLSPLRDLNAKLPEWVNHQAKKKSAFLRFGSPNVFSQFEPHLTLWVYAADNKASFDKDARQAILHFNKRFPLKSRTITFEAIGLGRVNAFGQVTQILARYPLSKAKE